MQQQLQLNKAFRNRIDDQLINCFGLKTQKVVDVLLSPIVLTELATPILEFSGKSEFSDLKIAVNFVDSYMFETFEVFEENFTMRHSCFDMYITVPLNMPGRNSS